MPSYLHAVSPEEDVTPETTQEDAARIIMLGVKGTVLMGAKDLALALGISQKRAELALERLHRPTDPTIH